MRVTEVDNQYLSFATHATIFAPLVEVAVFDHADTNQVVLGRVEFYASHMHVWRIARVLPDPLTHTRVVHVTLVPFSLLPKHLKVVLEHVDNLIRLQRFFDAVGDAVNKPV